MDKHYSVNDLFRLVGAPHLMWQREHPGQPAPDAETLTAWSRDAFLSGIEQHDGASLMLGKASLAKVVLTNRRLDLFDAVLQADEHLFREAVAMADPEVNRYFMERFDLRPCYTVIAGFYKYPATLGALTAGGYDINSPIPYSADDAKCESLLWHAVNGGYAQTHRAVLYAALEAGATPAADMIYALIDTEIKRVSTDIVRDMVDYAEEPLEFARAALDHVNRVIAIGSGEANDQALVNRFKIASDTLMAFRSELQQLLLNGYSQEARAERGKATRSGRRRDDLNDALDGLASEADDALADPFGGLLSDPFDAQTAYAPGL